MLVWLLPGLWALAGLAHLLHRWDRRHRRAFLTVYLRTLAVLDVWRGTTYALAATTSGVLLHLSVGGLTLTPRLISPVILLSTLIVYAAQGTPQATLLILNLFSSGLVWGVAIPLAVGLAVLVGWVPIPGGLAGMLLLGGGARLAELLAMTVGLYTVVVVYQFLANRSLPRWISGSLALLGGGIVQTALFGLGAGAGLRPAGPVCWPPRSAGRLSRRLRSCPWRLSSMPGWRAGSDLERPQPETGRRSRW